MWHSRFLYLFWLSADGQQVLIVSMADNDLKRKDKRSKCKKLKLFTSIAPNSKVRPQISFECLNSLIYESEPNQNQNDVKKNSL